MNKYSQIILITMLSIVCFSDVYANSKTHRFNTNRHWFMAANLGASVATSGDTQIPSIFGNPPLKSQPVYQTGYTTNLSLGYDFNCAFKLETEFAFQKLPFDRINDAIGVNSVTRVKNSNTKLFSIFLNGIYQLHFSSIIIPFIGAGIGYTRVENRIHPSPAIPVSENVFFTRKKLNYNTLSYHFMLGVATYITDNTLLSVNYTYFSTINTRSTGITNLGADSYKTKQRVSTNMFSIGFIYFFK